MSSGFAPLRSFVQRIERLNGEIAELNTDKKEVYAEAKATGLDLKTMRLLIAERSKEPQELAEQSELLDLYRAAMGGEADVETAPRVRAPARMREERPVVIGDTMCLSDIKQAWKDGYAVDLDRRFRSASVYFFHDRSRAEIKVGVSNNVDGRRATLSRERNTNLIEIGRIPGNRRLEIGFLKLFAPYQTEGEWFRAESEVFALIQAWIDDNSPAQPDFDRETGEIKASAELSELIETVTVLDRHGVEITEAPATVAGRDAETVPLAAGESPAPLSGNAGTKPCGSDEGIAVQTESTLAGMAAPSPAAETSVDQGTTVCAETNVKSASQPAVEPGPQDTPRPLPIAVHKTLEGKPLAPVKTVPLSPEAKASRERARAAGYDIGDDPEFVVDPDLPVGLDRRATVQQAGRA